MPLRTVLADWLAFALADLQGPDHSRPEQEDKEQRRKHRASGTEGDVAEDVEEGELRGELGQPIKHLLFVPPPPALAVSNRSCLRPETALQRIYQRPHAAAQ